MKLEKVNVFIHSSTISAIRIVDGMLNVSLEPDIDPVVPVNVLLVTPGHVDYEKVVCCCY